MIHLKMMQNDTNDNDNQHCYIDEEKYNNNNNNDDYNDDDNLKNNNDRSERTIVDDNIIPNSIIQQKEQHNNNNDNYQQCFTSIQQRRFWLPVCDTSITLCPSMDLISFGTYTTSSTSAVTAVTTTSSKEVSTSAATTTKEASSTLASTIIDEKTTTINHHDNDTKYLSTRNSALINNDFNNGNTTIHLHRTVNWQKLAMIQVPTTTTVAASTTTTTTTSATSTTLGGNQILQYKHIVWRPDGRYIAIADTTNRISLLSVEAMLNQNNHNSIGGGFSMMDNPYNNDEYEIDIPGKVYSFTIIQPQDINPIIMKNNQTTLTSLTSISGLSWVHIGKRHPAWMSSSSSSQGYNYYYDDQQQSNNIVEENHYDYYNQFIGDDDIIHDEDIADIMWEYRSYFVDREKQILPRSYYHTRSHLITSTITDHNENNNNNNTSITSSLPITIESSMNNNNIHSTSSPLPDSETTLSLLYVVSTTTISTTTNMLGNEIKVKDDTNATIATTIIDQNHRNNEQYHQISHLHAYLYGRYPIALNLDLGVPSYPFTDDNNNNNNNNNINHCTSKSIATSADLSHILIADYNKMSLNDSSNHGTKDYDQQNYENNNTNNYQYMTLYTIPAIIKNQYTFQQIGTLYAKIMTHIQTIKSNIPIILSSYISSLKPLDMKLDSLQNLLQRYGLLTDITKKENDDEHNDDDDDDLSQDGKRKRNNDSNNNESIRSLLVRYILSGYTRTMPNLSNAMDQFFTSAAMNDQLILRLERSLSAAISNVEKSYKQTIIAPMIALHYSITSLHGLAQYRHDIFHTTSSKSTSTSYTMLQKLITIIEIFNMTIEMTLQEIIQTRFQLRDFIAWLRSTGAQIKARGTSMKSVQRDNAKKRRITDIVMKRMLSYLQQSQQQQSQSTTNDNPMVDDEDNNMPYSSQDEKEKIYSHPLGITETILGLKLSCILSKELTSVDIINHGIIDHDNNNSNDDKQQHPLTELPINSSTTEKVNSHEMISGDNNKNVTTTAEKSNRNKMTTCLPTIPYVLDKVIQNTENVFEYPRTFVNKSIQRFFLRFPKYNTDSLNDRLVTTTRLGKGGISKVSYYGEAEPEGFFVPKVKTSLDSSSYLPSSGLANMKENKVPPSSESFRQWSIVAHVHHRNQIKLHAFPLQWTTTIDSVDDDDDDDENCFEEGHNEEKHLKMIQRTLAAPFQWTSILSFPEDCLILDVSFYGDDGKSSLALTASSAAAASGGYNNENTGKEGRQALCVLVACQEKSIDGINVSKLMLWLVDYDCFPYSCESIDIDRTYEKKDKQNHRDIVLSFCDSPKNTDNDTSGSSFVTVTPMITSETINDDIHETKSESGQTSIIAKVRCLSLSNISYEGQYKLVTSGSRGIGVVFVTENGTTSMELCDLEEDEEVDDDDDEEVEDDDDDGGVNQNATIDNDEEEEKNDDDMVRTEFDNAMDTELLEINEK